MDFDWQGWKIAEQERNAARDLRIRSLVEQAQAEAKRLAKLLKEADPSLSQVILFGSAARADPASEHFDIDLALKGSSRFAYLETIALADGFSVDLIQIEYAPPRLLENIQREGIVLYG